MAALTVTSTPTETGQPAPTPKSRGAFQRRSARQPHRLGVPARRGASASLFFSWIPMVRGFIMSFQRMHRGETTWVGWANFERILHDPSFATAWKNTAYFTLLALILGYALPFFVAILLNEFRHAKGYLRVLVYLPVMLPPASGLLLFKYRLLPGPRAASSTTSCTPSHLPTSQLGGLTAATMPALVIASTWLNMGGTILIYLAALQNIPGELYEAAELDGAGIWRADLARDDPADPADPVADVPAADRRDDAGVHRAADPGRRRRHRGLRDSPSSYLIYQHAFNYNDLNGAAALGVMLLIVLAVFSGLYSWLTRNTTAD